MNDRNTRYSYSVLITIKHLLYLFYNAKCCVTSVNRITIIQLNWCIPLFATLGPEFTRNKKRAVLIKIYVEADEKLKREKAKDTLVCMYVCACVCKYVYVLHKLECECPMHLLRTGWVFSSANEFHGIQYLLNII